MNITQRDRDFRQAALKVALRVPTAGVALGLYVTWNRRIHHYGLQEHNPYSLHINPAFWDVLSEAKRMGVITEAILHHSLGHLWRKTAEGNWEAASAIKISRITTKLNHWGIEASGVGSEYTEFMDSDYLDARSTEAIAAHLDDGAADGCSVPSIIPDDPEDKLSSSEFKHAMWSLVRFLKGDPKDGLSNELKQSLEVEVQVLQRRNTDWKTILENFLTSSSHEGEMSWSKPSRRFQGISDFIMPGPIRSPSGATIALAIDTSGSTMHMMPAFLGEFAALTRRLSFDTIHYLQCDNRIRYHQEFHQGFDESKAPNLGFGGGGTAFSPVFNRLNWHNVDPDCLVYLTDLECSEELDDPGYPVLWAVPTFVDQRFVSDRTFGQFIYLPLSL